MCDSVASCDVTKSQELKGQLMRRFRSSVFCGREELLLLLVAFNFQDLLHAQEQILNSEERVCVC